MDTKILLPSAISIVSIIIGWILNEFGFFFRAKREDRRQIGLMISYLLEIRNELKAITTIGSEIKKLGPIPPELEPMLKNMIRKLIPFSSNFTKQYEEAVNQISTANPILGFQLRNKTEFTAYIDKFRTIVPEEVGPIVNNIETNVSKELIISLGEIIIELSNYHGLKTKLKIKAFLKKPDLSSEDFKEYINKMIKPPDIK